ncbi:MAG: outer membrane protein assembly factor BamA [Gemmatimonadales bacterium]|nr:outer membrane protein assembly factor BamA [Gemmatimonadales bacterium]
MLRRAGIAAAAALALSATPAQAQDPQDLPPVDSLLVEGNVRNRTDQILAVAGLAKGAIITWRDIQRAISVLYRTGQFDRVEVEQREGEEVLILAIVVVERPLLRSWTLEGPEKLPPRMSRELIRLAIGQPVERVAAARARYQIDSMYHKQGYYTASVTMKETKTEDGGVALAFTVDEGNRVAIARVEVEGNSAMPTKEMVGAMATKPEGFWWFRSGEYNERELELDLRERLPRWYGDRGMIDFQVVGDTIIDELDNGKATLKLKVEEGDVYTVGTFEILGNRRYSLDELSQGFPFGLPGQVGTGQVLGGVFNRSEWEKITAKVQETYSNAGYITAQVEPEQAVRTLPDGKKVLDLRWRIQEGAPATVAKVNIVGNEVTHERVIREAIVILPGQLFSRDALMRSYQNISNLGYFEELPNPDVDFSENGVDVTITFRVTEKRTGNINFGASVGQGTGLGGFLGLEEPNLFGRGKRGRLQWQFGRNINDFSLSYSDPNIKESNVSGTLTVYNSRQRYVIGDLGRQQQEGASLQLGLPFLGSRVSRVFASYGFQRIRYSEGSLDLQSRFQCAPCSRSTLGLSFLRETRVGLPFPIAGSMVQVGIEQNGGPLGGTGDYQKLDLDTRWYAPLGRLGGTPGSLSGGVQFTLGVTAKSGFIFGNPGGFFTQLYSLGGVQFGIPLRGYSEFSITPNGFDALAGGQRASADGFGKAYAAFTVEAGARVSQALYLSTFLDAGNVYRSVRQYDPTRLYRGAGVGVALISPLGPIGVDLGYGFDKLDVQGRPAPGFQIHFRLGNFF